MKSWELSPRGRSESFASCRLSNERPGPDHALDALRYLVMRIDKAYRLARSARALTPHEIYIAEHGWTSAVLQKLEGVYE